MQRTSPRSTGENSVPNAGHLFGDEIVGESDLVASATLVPSVAADSTRFSPTTSERGVKGRLSELGVRSVCSGQLCYSLRLAALCPASELANRYSDAKSLCDGIARQAN